MGSTRLIHSRRVRVLPALTLAASLAATLAACDGEPRPELDAQDRQQIAQIVAALRSRLQAQDEGAAAGDSLDMGTQLPTIEDLPPHLWEDPARGQLFLEAIGDSLEAMRTELFPPAPDPELPDGG